MREAFVGRGARRDRRGACPTPAEEFAAVGHDGFDVFGHLGLVEGFGLFCGGEFLGVLVFALGEVGQAGAGLFALFGEAGMMAIDLLAVFVQGAPVVSGLLVKGRALFGDFGAVQVVLAAVFVGEDAKEIFEEGGTGFGGGGQGEGALLDEVEAGGAEVGGAAGKEGLELIDGGKGVFAGDVEGGGEVDFLAIALEAIGGDAAAEGGPDFLLGFLVGFVAEEFVNVLELFAGERGELGEGGGFLIYGF